MEKYDPKVYASSDDTLDSVEFPIGLAMSDLIPTVYADNQYDEYADDQYDAYFDSELSIPTGLLIKVAFDHGIKL